MLSLKPKSYRVSSYTICVKLPDDNERYLLVHGYTGAIDLVNSKVAALVKARLVVSDAAFSQLPVTTETIQSLIRRGYLTTRSPMEEKAYVRNMADSLHAKHSTSSSFLFLVAYDCNFRCPYCYENEISDYGRGWSGKTFDKDLVDRAYEAMLEIQPNRARHSKQITLYGGEPLLARNHAIVKYIVDQGIERGYGFGAITNGYDLHHFTDLLGPKKIEFLQISFDGDEETHNRSRLHYKATETFGPIVKNMRMALSRDVAVSVRINTAAENVKTLPHLMEFFEEQGFNDFPNFKPYTALVHHVEDSASCSSAMTGGKAPSPPQSSSSLIEIEPISQADSDSEPADFSEVPFEYGSTATEINGEIEPTETPLEYLNDEQYIDFESEEEEFQVFSASNGVNKMERETAKIDLSNDLLLRRNFTKEYYKYKHENPDLLRQLGCQDYGIKRIFERAFKGKGLLDLKPIFCGAQTGMVIFDPFGDLYTCWEVVGSDRYRVGTYSDIVRFDNPRLDEWYNRNVSKVTSCSKCKYSFFCGGGCAAHAYAKHGGNTDSSYCDEYPKIFHIIVPELYDQLIGSETRKSEPVY